MVAGWDEQVYILIEHQSESDVSSGSTIIRKYDLFANQVGELTITADELLAANLYYLGLLVAADAEGNLYTNVVNVFREGQVVSQEALVQINPQGMIRRIIDRDTFIRPATDVIDQKGRIYLWDIEIDADQVEICQYQFD